MLKEIYTPQEEIEEYFLSPALNQGKIKTIARSLYSYKRLISKSGREQELFFYENEAMLMGSAMDYMLTSGLPLESKYCVATMEKKPSDTICSIVKEVMSMVGEGFTFLHEYEDKILESCTNHGYQSNWGDAAKVRAVIRDGAEYAVELFLCSGLTTLSQEEYNTILKGYTQIREWLEKTYPNCTIIYQKPLYFNLQGVDCKALPDAIVYNPDTRRVIILDFKLTTVPITNFDMIFRDRRYDVQAAFYKEGLMAYGYKVHEMFDSDRIRNISFTFVVYSTKSDVTCDFEVSNLTIDNAIKGFKYRGAWIPGITEGIEKYLWYEKNGWEEEWMVKQDLRRITFKKIETYDSTYSL